MRTLAIIPAFNEEQALPAVLEGLRRDMPDIDVLVIDDGSADSTAAVARAGGAFVAQLPFNMGIGAALRTGFRFAAERGYDRAFQFDADGQHGSREVGVLMRALDSGADMAIGSRFLDETGYVVGRTRGLAMTMLRLLVRWLVGRPFTDTSSGFRGFSRGAIEVFARSYPKEYMDSVEALVSASYAGLKVVEVPTQMHERAGGVPSNRSFRLAYHYIRVLLLLLVTATRRSKRGTYA